MKNVSIVGNLKSFKNEFEAKDWLEVFKKINQSDFDLTKKDVIVCPAFTQLLSFSSYFSSNNINARLGAQNVSPFDEGPFTGEVNAKQLKDFITYVLIGHSERRENFGETEDMLAKKVAMVLKYGLIPIFLVQGKDNIIPQGVSIVAYEPVFAIGTGNPDTPESADALAKEIKATRSNLQVLYGGSVKSTNVKDFTQKTNIDGVLVGGASLEAEEFLKIIKNA